MRRLLTLVLCAVVLWSSGCGKEESAPEHKPAKGRLKKPASGRPPAEGDLPEGVPKAKGKGR
jgi:hypothetical protein